MRRRVLRVLAALTVALCAAAAVAYISLRHDEPTVTAGDADALARRMLAAVNDPAWQRTGAVRWTFFDGTRHLWDRARNLDRVDLGDTRVWIDLSTRRGVAMRRGQRLTGAALDDALARAWARWCNDAWWLNPVSKVFDQGVTRSLARDDRGRDALWLRYASGGVTPGDRYLWIVGENGLPRAWRMWVQVLPVPGLEASWEGWITLATGARVATVHRLGPLTRTLRDVAGAATLDALEAGDAFAPLTAR